jgi:hypothetical protein
MPDTVRLGTVLTNADMAETMDSSDMMHHFFRSHPDIREWCLANLAALDERKLSIWPNEWGRYHTEWTVELRNLSQTEAVAARLRFS